MRTLSGKFSLCFIILFALGPNGFTQMRQVYTDINTPDNDISKVSFYSASEGYVAFRDWIGYTTDSGRTFLKKPITVSNVNFNGYGVNLTFGFGINGVKAFNRDTIIAFGDYGLVPAILYSTNGGNNFKLVFHSQFDPYNLRTGVTDIIFPGNGNIGFAVDADRILKTTDKGITWTLGYISSGTFFDHLEAIDNNNVFAFSSRSGSGNKLLKTTNGGSFWQQLTLPAGQSVSYVHFITASKGWMNTSNNTDGGRTYYTSNGGGSWALKNSPVIAPFEASKMKFINDSTGFALSGLYQVYKTTDSGKIWERLPRDNQFEYLGYTFNDLQVWNNSQLWAGGGQGFLELNTNLSGNTVPKTYFNIDTSNYLATGTVTLINYSKKNYQYQWYVNDVLVSTAYHASYVHDLYSLKDSVKLIISNGEYADTLVQHQQFYPPVIVSSFTPVSGGIGTIINIKGEHFTDASGVYFGGAPAGYTVLSDSAIRATVGSGATGNVKVVTPYGYGSLAGFTFIPPPVITSFTPTTAMAGTTVTITGQNFNEVTKVVFGDVPAVSFNVLSPTSITAVVGVGASGNISVTAIGGTGSAPGFLAQPNITSFTPSSGTFGTYMTITGTGFGGATSVKVGNTTVASFKVNSYTSITAVLSNGLTGDVMVTTPGGSSSKSAFTYYEPPVITSFAPRSGPIGTTVIITGKNFDPVPAKNIVYFGAVKAEVTAASALSLTVKVPVGASFEPITVNSNNLVAASKQPFTVTFSNGGSVTANSFPTVTALLTGTNNTPIYAASGDIDGDGKPDLLIVNRAYYANETAVSIYRNTTTANTVAFDAKVDFVLQGAQAVAVGDMDGDGKLDMVVTRDESSVAVFRNTSTSGNISFENKLDVTTSRGADELVIEDFDGDGKQDIALESWWEGKIVIHRNISNPGSMNFSAGVNIPAVIYRNIVAHDLDNDGKAELIDETNIFKNKSTRGTIAFGPAITYSNNVTHSRVATGDVDGDGKIDIVTSDQNRSNIAVFKNTGTNTIALSSPLLYDGTQHPSGTALSDVDGDGKADIIVTLMYNTLSVLKNTSTAAAISYAPKVDFAPREKNNDNKILMTDLNGDGKPDAVVMNQFQGPVSILMNDVKPEPFISSFTPTISSPGGSIRISGVNFTGTTAVTIGGLPVTSFVINADTLITAIVATGNSGVVSVTNNIGIATRAGFVCGFPPVITSFAPLSGQAGSSITINGNYFSATPSENIVQFGSVKATVTAASVNALTVIVPHGSLYAPITVTTNNRTAYSNAPFITTFRGAGATFSTNSFGDKTSFSGRGGKGVTGDLDGDGKLDVVFVNVNSIGVARNTSIASAISFAPNVSIAMGNSPNALAIGDIDGDTRPDIVVSYATSKFISVLINTSIPGSLSFAPRADFPTSAEGSGSALVIRDLDKDGIPDIIVSGYDQGTVTVFRNLSTPGNPLIDKPVNYSIEGSASDIKLRDMDGDNQPDIVATSNGNISAIAILRNTSIAGTISFALNQDVLAGPSVQEFMTGDLDGDERPDFAVANLQSVSIFKNQGTGTSFSFSKTDYPVTYYPRNVWLNDMDGDGKLEFAIQRETTSLFGVRQVEVSIYKNKSITGTIAFETPYQVDAGNYLQSSATADMDADGKPDLLLYASVVNNIGSFVILRNKTGEPGNITLCPGGNSSITSNVTGITYRWQENKGNGFADISNNTNFSGTASQVLQLTNIPSSWNGYKYRCIVDNDTSVITGLAFFNSPVVDAGPDKQLCPSSTVGVMIGAGQYVDGLTYNWSPTTGLDSDDLPQTFANPASTTTYVLTVTNKQGCSAKDTVVVSRLAITAPTITTAGATAFCYGGSVQLTSSSAANNQWYREGLPIAGATAKTYTANEWGRYSVRTVADGCMSDMSATVMVTVAIAPMQPTITSSGTVNFCQGQKILLSSSDTGSHQWFKDGVRIPAATSSSYQVTEQGTYAAKKESYFGCLSDISNEIVVTVHPAPAAPVITQNGNLLSSSISTGNQWYLNDSIIPGANAQTHMVTASGAYKVKVTTNGCTSAFSNSISFNNISKIQVGPNPVTDRIYIRYPTNTEPQTILLMDMTGQSTLEKGTFITSYELNMSGYKPGMYIIQIINNKTGEREQRVIMKI